MKKRHKRIAIVAGVVAVLVSPGVHAARLSIETLARDLFAAKND